MAPALHDFLYQLFLHVDIANADTTAWELSVVDFVTRRVGGNPGIARFPCFEAVPKNGVIGCVPRTVQVLGTLVACGLGTAEP